MLRSTGKNAFFSGQKPHSGPIKLMKMNEKRESFARPDSADPPEALASEIRLLFQAMLPGELAERFCELLAYHPRRWSKIDPWKVWEHIQASRIIEINEKVEALLSVEPLAVHAQRQVAVLRCGHESPRLERLSLKEALRGQSTVFEGFISVVPGKLGLAINHDGGLCLLRR